MWKLKRIVTVTESCSEDIVDSHESDAYRQKKTTLLHSPEFFSLYRRQVELSQKIYANSLYVIAATWMKFMFIIEHQSNPTNAYM